jgi:hypothetical protein
MTLPILAETDPAVQGKVYFTDPQLCERYHCTKATLWRRRKLDPRFPKPVTGFGAHNLTPVEEILAYDALIAVERQRPPARKPRSPKQQEQTKRLNALPRRTWKRVYGARVMRANRKRAGD